MKLSNCTCGKKWECDCVPYFDSYLNNTTSVLDVGNLVSANCTFDEYVIDWYRDGVHAMVSGKGNDPEIDTFHPFTGTEAVPVISGEWQPVLRYVVVSGVVMYPKPMKCKNWCADLDVILPSVEVPFITVNELNCDSQNQAPTALYNWEIVYTTDKDYSLASRTIRYYINSSAKYLAYLFRGEGVADQISFYYNEETTPLMSYIVGTDLAATNTGVSPEEIDYAYIATVIDLTGRTFASGDYIKIVISPSVKDPTNYNTIWTLRLKCLPTGTFDNCASFFNSNMSTIDLTSIYATYNTTECRYEFHWDMLAALSTSFSTSLFNQYNMIGSNVSGQLSSGATVISKFAYLNNKVVANWRTLYPTGYDELTGYVTASKSGNVLTFAFDTQSDYLAWQTQYDTLMASANMANYSTDPTSLNHYKSVVMSWRETMLTCGDTYISRSYRYHISSPVSFNGYNGTHYVITIQMLNVTNGIIAQACNEEYDDVQTEINFISSSIALADFTGTTHCAHLYPFNGRYITSGLQQETSREYAMSYRFWSQSLNSICDLPLFTEDGMFPYFGFYFMYIKITITDSGDPINNFRIESKLNSATGDLYASYSIIYEKSNGVQIIP